MICFTNFDGKLVNDSLDSERWTLIWNSFEIDCNDLKIGVNLQILTILEFFSVIMISNRYLIHFPYIFYLFYWFIWHWNDKSLSTLLLRKTKFWRTWLCCLIRVMRLSWLMRGMKLNGLMKIRSTIWNLVFI